MTQTNNTPKFDHVTIPSLRDVLEGRILPMTHTLAGCLAVTSAALEQDAQNEDVPFAVLDAREQALEIAYDAHENGDNQTTLDALRRCWSV
jgi:cephalosporin-C deacetylase-like acetyl esterase